MNKAPDAFRTISEVADYLETPAHVLRFWETRFPQVKPVKGAGGRRYYRPSDVALLAGIRRLLHTDGMTIRGVQKILRDQGVRHVAELGGEVLPDAEPLEALLPPARAPAEVVPLRRDPPDRPSRGAVSDLTEDPDLTAEPSELEISQSFGGEPGSADPESDLLDPDGTERTDSAPDDDAAARLGADASSEGAPPDGTASGDPALAAPLSEGASNPTRAAAPLASPALTGFGGFALDLDVPRAGEGGFIAFANGDAPAPPAKPEGYVHPEARPKRTGAPADRQASLFDRDDEAPQEIVESLAEDDIEAPHVFVEDDEGEGAEITAFPAVGEPDPQAEPADDLLAQGLAAEPVDLPDPDLPNPDLLIPDLPGPDLPYEDRSLAAARSAEAAVQALLDESPESVADVPPSDPMALAGSLPLTDAVPLAGLVPRLRHLGVPEAERLFALADLQARLGLLHAQMVEAAARPRRTPGE